MERHGCVNSFCYLGDTLDGDGGADLASLHRSKRSAQIIKTRIRNVWMKFPELLPFLTSRAPPLERKVECMPVVSEVA